MSKVMEKWKKSKEGKKYLESHDSKGNKKKQPKHDVWRFFKPEKPSKKKKSSWRFF